MAEGSSRVLTAEFMERLKSKLNANPYTDEQLHRAAFFMVAPILYTAGEIRAADVSTVSIMTTANLFAGALLADFINTGCISVSAIDRFMERAADEMKEGKTSDVQSEGNDSD